MAHKPINLNHIPPEDHQGVGLVANSWAHLEGIVERIIWRLARMDDNTGAAITTHIGIKNRLDAACALADLEFPDTPQTNRLMSLHGYILGNEIYGKRNEIVHSRTLHFLGLLGGTVRPTYKARRRLKKEAKSVTPVEYKDTSHKILATASELREILADFIEMITAREGAPSP